MFDDAHRAEVITPGFKLIDHTCEGRSGGGTAYAGEKSSFEYSEWVVNCGSLANLRFSLFTGFRILLNIRSQQALFYAFTSFLESVIMSSELLLITGDFNMMTTVTLIVCGFWICLNQWVCSNMLMYQLISLATPST